MLFGWSPALTGFAFHIQDKHCFGKITVVKRFVDIHFKPSEMISAQNVEAALLYRVIGKSLYLCVKWKYSSHISCERYGDWKSFTVLFRDFSRLLYFWTSLGTNSTNPIHGRNIILSNSKIAKASLIYHTLKQSYARGISSVALLTKAIWANTK